MKTFTGVIAAHQPECRSHDSYAADSLRGEKSRRCKLKPQMLARVRIVTRPGEALVVPQDALIFEIDGYYAYVDVRAWHARAAQSRDRVVERKRFRARASPGSRPGEHVVTRRNLQVNALWHEAHGESS